MIEIVEQDGKKLVCSLDLYKSVGYHPWQYARWLRTHVYNNAEKDLDYFDMQDTPSGKIASGPKCVKYLFTIELAITVCLFAKTESAKKLKTWLQKNR